MKCQRCPKPATLHITEIYASDQYEEVHLCEDCARKYLYEPQQKKPGGTGTTASADDDVSKCMSCGMTFSEFRNNGRLGCAQDYDVFRAELLPLLQTIHNETRHAGKTPRHAPRHKTTQAELTQLRQRLNALVSEENYEEAAKVRDRIRELEGSDPPRD